MVFIFLFTPPGPSIGIDRIACSIMTVDPPVAANPGRTNSSTWLHTSSTTTPNPTTSTSDQPSGTTSSSAMAPSSSSYYPLDSGADSTVDDEYDYDDDDQDSAYGDDSFIGDDTKTLSCYITDYRFEFGRRYHSYRDGAYWVCCVSRQQPRCVCLLHVISPRHVPSGIDLGSRVQMMKSPMSNKTSLTTCIT